MPNLKKHLNWRVWTNGLIAAVVGGAANAISVIAIEPDDFNLTNGLAKVGKVALISGLIGAGMYLKQSPLPPEENDEN